MHFFAHRLNRAARPRDGSLRRHRRDESAPDPGARGRPRACAAAVGDHGRCYHARLAVQALYALQNGFMGIRALGALLRRLSRRTRPDPDHLLARPHLRRHRPLRHGRLAARGARAAAERPAGALHRGGSARAPPRTWSASSPTTSTSWCSPTCTTITPAAPSSSRSPSSSCSRTSTRTPTTPRPSSRPSTTGRTSTCPGYRWRLLDGDTELVPGVTVLRIGRPHARPSVAAGRAAGDGPRDPHRRRLLLARARRRPSACPASCGTPPSRCTRSSG